jgi:hypothetical protein
MDGGQACREIEEATTVSFHADVRSLCESKGPFAEPPPSSRRSTTPTTPYAGYADTLPAPSSPSPSQPEWCVDTGALMHTMTTFELWEALERGDVLAWMRVWREGMECWTPVGEIADFACALAAIPPPPADPDPDPDPEPTPAPELSADADTGPLSTPTVTPEPPPPASAVRPVRRPLGSAGWIALGSAIALAALISAILVRLASPPPTPVAVSGASSPVEATPAVVPPSPADEPLSPETPHHTERGQRRLPRAGRVAYGR